MEKEASWLVLWEVEAVGMWVGRVAGRTLAGAWVSDSRLAAEEAGELQRFGEIAGEKQLGWGRPWVIRRRHRSLS
jgi:hypothetical protein